MNQEAYQRLETWDCCLIDSGLTTWPETLQLNTRSDCHAWSVTPGIELFQLLAGIYPAATGFSAIRLNPLKTNCGINGKLSIPQGVFVFKIDPTEQNSITIQFSSPVPVITKNQKLPPGSHQIIAQ